MKKKINAFLTVFCVALKRSRGLVCLKIQFTFFFFFFQKGDIVHKENVKTIIFPASLFACRPAYVMGIVVLITHI